MMENRIFTLCRMITWVVFLRIFWNFISSLPVERGGSLSFLTIFTFAVPELLDLILTENRIFTLCRMITWVVFLRMFWNFIISNIIMCSRSHWPIIFNIMVSPLIMKISCSGIEGKMYKLPINIHIVVELEY
jgi:hypothetical protein